MFGAPIPADNDLPNADGVPNNVEYWMQRVGVLLDSGGNQILSWGTNAYNDTDGDGIPDLVETSFTLTDPTLDDRIACAGGGSPDMTGQYEVRRAADLGATASVLTDELAAVSVCHTNDSFKVFSPRMGYATTASVTGTGPYTVTASWPNGGGTGVAVVFSGDCAAPCTDPTVTVTGTLSIGGASSAAAATRRATSTASAAAVSGLYAVQVAPYPIEVGASANKLGDLGSEALQINVLSQSEARVYTKDTYEAYP
ncbi:hypothetical protein, partial [Chromohalobacter sp.]|uniref:hypothetical protein n=1 Tax=Chromohalobacter sp. TaxID=50740 RepID=UPI0025843449